MFKEPIKGFALLLATFIMTECDALGASSYPVVKSELVVEDGAADGSLTNFRWLDDHRLIALVGERPDPTPRGRKRMLQSLKIWDVRSNMVSVLAPPDIDGLCVADGVIRYLERNTAPDGKETFEFYSGTESAIRKVEAGRFSRFNCRLLTEHPLPAWTQKIPEINIRRLKPEHGFIVIDRDSPTHWPRSVQLYRKGNGQNEGVDLTPMIGSHAGDGRVAINLRYYEFKNAYYINSPGSNPESVWLFPDGKIESSSDLGRRLISVTGRTGTLSTAIASGKVFGASRVTEEPVGDGGLFFQLEGDRKPAKRLVKGRIGQEIEVSPDGCKVAYLNDEREYIDPKTPILFHKLQVINLCSEKKP